MLIVLAQLAGLFI